MLDEYRPSAHSVQKADRLGELLKALMVFVNRSSGGDSHALTAREKLSLSQIVALHVLQRTGPHTVSYVAERLRLSLAATSYLLDRLVQAKLIKRAEDTVDRRKKRIAITPSGVQLLERFAGARALEITRAMAPLDRPLRVEFQRALERVIEQLEQRASMAEGVAGAP